MIRCPWCGERDEVEFSLRRRRPRSPTRADPAALSDEEWAQFLFFRDNPKGAFAERWVHTHGCRRWFDVVRDTVTTSSRRAEVSRHRREA